MLHVEYLAQELRADGDYFIKRASGRYYTGEIVGRRLAEVVAAAFRVANPDALTIRLIDPFGGDARLIEWLMRAWRDRGYPPLRWEVTIWDRHEFGLALARDRLIQLAASHEAEVNVAFKLVDSFREALAHFGTFDIVLTNPPWELLKPDRRELDSLPKSLRKDYLASMKRYDAWLANHYPKSQPRRKFAGWGTNLSRVGLELSLALARADGIVGIVLPASLLADDQSLQLREHLLTKNAVLDIAYYPAEAKFYERADVPSVAVVVGVEAPPAASVPIFSYRSGLHDGDADAIKLDLLSLALMDFVLPVAFGARAVDLLAILRRRFPQWIDLESDSDSGLWAGREVDETGLPQWLKPATEGGPPFIKGRMIGRYRLRETPTRVLVRAGWSPPPSVAKDRIVWRDVSRPTQQRRMIATRIPSGWVAGNSLGVAYFRDDDQTALLSLLGIMNSTTFEFQLRAHLATGHISLSSLRKVSLPPVATWRGDGFLADRVALALNDNSAAAAVIDAYVARTLFQLSENEYRTILDLFDKITAQEYAECLSAFRSLENGRSAALGHSAPGSS